MKKFILVTFVSYILSLVLFSCVKFPENKDKLYCGPVVEKFRTDAGYKSSPEAHIVFYSDSLKRNVDVQVTWNTYANQTVGENVCFTLSKFELSR